MSVIRQDGKDYSSGNPKSRRDDLMVESGFLHEPSPVRTALSNIKRCRTHAESSPDSFFPDFKILLRARISC